MRDATSSAPGVTSGLITPAVYYRASPIALIVTSSPSTLETIFFPSN